MSKHKIKKEVDEPYYKVEKILQRKKQNGKFLYLIKWEGYGEDHNSFEPEENLTPALINAYNEELRVALQNSRTPSQIIGLTDPSHPKPLCFLVRYPDCSVDYVKKAEGNKLWPQKVIEFYEKKLKFETKE